MKVLEFNPENKSSSDYHEGKIKEFVEKYGEEILHIPGFINFLLNQDNRIVDVKVDIANQIGVYLLDMRNLFDKTRVIMSSVIGVYYNSKVKDKVFRYKDPENEQLDDESKDFKQIEIKQIKDNEILILAIPNEEIYAPQEFHITKP